MMLFSFEEAGTVRKVRKNDHCIRILLFSASAELYLETRS